MSVEGLDKIFEPENVAVIGASNKKGSVGHSLMDNLVNRPQGKAIPVNPNRDSVLGLDTADDVTKISDPIDLAVIATPAPTVPEVVEQCGKAGIPGIIVITAGFSETGADGEKMEERIEKIRQEYGMRILGPNCLGVINPEQNLNATFTNQMAETGNEVFISQSGSLASATLDWAISAQYGFKAFVSIGNMVDIDFGDLIDYFGEDKETKAIMLYLESIKKVRKFMSASRNVALNKPIMAVKPGKYEPGTRAVAARRRSTAGADEVYEAAFKRIGITRVDSIGDLFTCSEILAKQKAPKGSRLAIVTNAGGPGAMASDAVFEEGGKIAPLSEGTTEELKTLLPYHAHVNNPVDVTRDATPNQFREAVEICAKDDGVDGLLCIYAPVGTLSTDAVAKELAKLKGEIKKPILACWMGGERIKKGREILRNAGFSVQFSPEQSVKNYMYLNRYARNRERLLETPEELSIEMSPPKNKIESMLRETAQKGRKNLTRNESKKILDTYNVTVPRNNLAKNPEEAVKIASDIGFPVSLKVHSPIVAEKNKIDEAVYRLNSKNEVRRAAIETIEKVKENGSGDETVGLEVQKMVPEDKIKLALKSKKDPLFGSTIMLGEMLDNEINPGKVAIGLPPLNQNLSKLLIKEAGLYEPIKSLKDSSKILRSLEETLVKISQLIIDFPEIDELSIEPLVRKKNDFLALDSYITIDKNLALSESKSHENLAIVPYPRKYITEWELEDGTPVTLRPIKPEDESLVFELLETFSQKTLRQRFFKSIKEFSHSDVVRHVNIDYRREMAIVAEIVEDGDEKIIGVSQLEIDSDLNSGDIAVVVGDSWQGMGLGEKLVRAVIDVADDKGLENVRAEMMSDNYRIINLCKKLGAKLENKTMDGRILMTTATFELQ